MKKLALFLLLACAYGAAAQAPQAINYQAIARDANGKPMPNADVTAEFSVLDGSVSGQAVYRERHQTETNAFGLFTLEIGRGTVVSGSFAAIDWGGGAKFLEVEINGTLQGTTQLLAVPYALFAEKTRASQCGQTALTFNPLANDAPGLALTSPEIVTPPSPENGSLTNSGSTDLVFQLTNLTFDGVDSGRYRVCLQACPTVCDEARVILSRKSSSYVITPNDDQLNAFFNPVFEKTLSSARPS